MQIGPTCDLYKGRGCMTCLHYLLMHVKRMHCLTAWIDLPHICHSRCRPVLACMSVWHSRRLYSHSILLMAPVRRGQFWEVFVRCLILKNMKNVNVRNNGKCKHRFCSVFPVALLLHCVDVLYLPWQIKWRWWWWLWWWWSWLSSSEE